MAFLIDGHNLIARIPDISLSDPDDEAKLVMRLKQYMMRRGKKCTVVFDQGLPGGVSRNLSNANVEVLFAHSKTDADRIIKERIRSKRDSGYWQVVTNDQAVAEVARSRGVKVIDSAIFASWMAAAGVSDTPDDENPNPVVPPDEVEEMLRLFSERKPPRRRK